MLVIAVTGGIGSGKSTVADLFKDKGIPIIDTDQIARDLVQPGEPLLQQIIAEFGQEYLDPKGQLKRKDLGNLIFTDQAARNKLEAMMHPAIHAAVIAQLNKLNSPYCLIVIPLLARSKHAYPYDRVLLVDIPETIQIQRTMQRDQQASDFVKHIIATQPPRDELLKLADDVLDNSGNLSDLTASVAKLHQRYLALAEKNP